MRTTKRAAGEREAGRREARAAPAEPRSSRSLLVAISFGAVIALASVVYLLVGYDRAPELPPLSYADLTGSNFVPPPGDPLRSPDVRELQLPPIPAGLSVWGATGRDPRGRIWVGVSARSAAVGAHLLQYDPEADVWHVRGSVVEQLKAAGLHRAGEGQAKIHSKIVPGEDGWLYFASSDEDGEVPDSTPPRWGGHLWRIHPDTFQWEHLAAVPEGLVAVSGVGRYMYALGYWGHVLYAFDVLTREQKRAVVGSAGGHVSRNFLADVRGHVYVPRVQARGGGRATAALVEYDSELRELAATPLEFYFGKETPGSNHGIVGLAYLPDGRMLFTTHLGHVYVVEPQPGKPSKVTAAGWFHPTGESYPPSLFPLGGSRLVAGVAQRSGGFDWVVFELTTGVSAAFPLDTKDLQRVLLYGSISRDNAGRFYVGGWAGDGTGNQRPLVLQIAAGR